MMGELTYVLCFQIKQTFKGISICQEKYVKDLLKKYDLADSASVKCLMLPPKNLGPDNETLFRAMIGSLMYLTASRHDIQFSTCLCARLAGCNLDRKSTSGGCQLLGGKLLCWSAKKQSYVAMSSAEAEYVATTGCYAQVLWIKSQLADYDVLYDKNQFAYEVPLTSRVLKVAKISKEQYKSLILPSGEENADDSANKSLFETNVQPVTQSKAPTDKRSRKKNITSSTKPQTSQISKESPLTTPFTDVQPDEVPIATTDTTQSLDASELVERQGNQPKTADAEKFMHVQEQNVEMEVKSSRLISMGNVTFEQLIDEYDLKQSANLEGSESSYYTKFEIKVVKRFKPTKVDDDDQIAFLGPMYEDIDTDLDKADSDLHSMPVDEVESVFGFEDTKSSAEEYDKAGSKPSDPFGPLLAKTSSLSTKVKNLESSLAKKVTDKLEDSVPKMVADVFKEKMPELIFDSLKHILSQIIKESIQQALLKIDQRVQETLQTTELLSAIHAKAGKSVRKYVGKEMQIVKDRLSYSVEKLNQGDVNLHELMSLMKDMVFLLDSSNIFRKANAEGEKVSLEEDKALELAEEAKTKAIKEAKIVKEAKANTRGGEGFNDSLFNTTSSEYSPTPPRDENKGKDIATKYNPIKELIPPMDEGRSAPTMQNLR
nr:hypothetical protein [Tanacetum cinerariifolium]